MSEVFTNHPVIWIKWAVVFVVLIGSFIISFKIIKMIGYVLQGQKKVDNARKVFCMEDYQWNPFGGMIYLFLIFVPFVLAALTAMALDIPFEGRDGGSNEEREEEILETGAFTEGGLTHNGITVNFKTPEVGTGGGEYAWCTYYTDEEEGTDVKVEFGFVEELPSMPEGSRREDCELWGKKMLYEIKYIPFEDEYGDIREQEQLWAYWQLSEETYFMVVATGVSEELSNAYDQLLNDEKFQSSFEINSSVE